MGVHRYGGTGYSIYIGYRPLPHIYPKFGLHIFWYMILWFLLFCKNITNKFWRCMNYDDIPECDRYQYLGHCEWCDASIEVLTQEDGKPEYYTQVYVRCVCGEYLEFRLPVN